MFKQIRKPPSPDKKSVMNLSASRSALSESGDIPHQIADEIVALFSDPKNFGAFLQPSAVVVPGVTEEVTVSSTSSSASSSPELAPQASRAAQALPTVSAKSARQFSGSKRYFYNCDDMDNVVRALVFEQLGGFAEDHWYLTNNTQSTASLPTYTLITPSVRKFDKVGDQAGAPLSYFLDKEVQPAPVTHDERRDIFDELLPILQENPTVNARILFPVNDVSKNHWQSVEIVIGKTNNNFHICIYLHDPKYKVDAPNSRFGKESAMYQTLGEACIKRINDGFKSPNFTYPNKTLFAPKYQVLTSEYNAITRQKDGHSCGPIVCHEIIQRAQDLPLELDFGSEAKLRMAQIELVAQSTALKPDTKDTFLKNAANGKVMQPAPQPVVKKPAPAASEPASEPELELPSSATDASADISEHDEESSHSSTSWDELDSTPLFPAGFSANALLELENEYTKEQGANASELFANFIAKANALKLNPVRILELNKPYLKGVVKLANLSQLSDNALICLHAFAGRYNELKQNHRSLEHFINANIASIPQDLITANGLSACLDYLPSASESQRESAIRDTKLLNVVVWISLNISPKFYSVLAEQFTLQEVKLWRDAIENGVKLEEFTLVLGLCQHFPGMKALSADDQFVEMVQQTILHNISTHQSSDNVYLLTYLALVSPEKHNFLSKLEAFIQIHQDVLPFVEMCAADMGSLQRYYKDSTLLKLANLLADEELGETFTNILSDASCTHQALAACVSICDVLLRTEEDFGADAVNRVYDYTSTHTHELTDLVTGVESYVEDYREFSFAPSQPESLQLLSQLASYAKAMAKYAEGLDDRKAMKYKLALTCGSLLEEVCEYQNDEHYDANAVPFLIAVRLAEAVLAEVSDLDIPKILEYYSSHPAPSNSTEICTLALAILIKEYDLVVDEQRELCLSRVSSMLDNMINAETYAALSDDTITVLSLQLLELEDEDRALFNNTYFVAQQVPSKTRVQGWSGFAGSFFQMPATQHAPTTVAASFTPAS